MAEDPKTNAEARIGELDYYHHGMTPIWCSTHAPTLAESLVQTRLLCADVDVDGVDEVVFGTQDGRVVVVDPVSMATVLDMKVAVDIFYTIAVGNLDDDPGVELVCIAGWNGTVTCVDFQTGAVQWQQPMDDHPARDLILFDDDRDGRKDVLVVGSGAYTRLSGSGHVVYEGSLEIFNHTLAPAFSVMLGDLDRDYRTEALVIDNGFEWMWGGNGEHLWLIDVGTGAIEDSREYTGLTFSSRPVLAYLSSLRQSVLVGLHPGRSGGKDLFVLDPVTMEHSLLDLTSDVGGNEPWDRIAVASINWDPLIVLCTGYGACIGWQPSSPTGVVWAECENLGGACFPPTIVVCDIDNDSAQESITVHGDIIARDVMTGELEFSTRQFHVDKVACGDTDGDGAVELCIDTWRYTLDGSMNDIYVIDSPKNPQWEVSVVPGPATLYAAQDSHLGLLVRNMTTRVLPPLIEVAFSNTEWGEYASALLDVRNATVSTAKDDRLIVKAFSVNETQGGIAIDLALLPGWSFSDEGPSGVHLRFRDARGRYFDCLVADAFRVERDLVIVGDLGMSSGYGPVPDGSWVRPGEEIKVEGFDVGFEGAPDVRPARTAFTILVRAGDQWFERAFIVGVPMAFVFRAPQRDGPFSICLVVNQTAAGILGEASPALCLAVDATAPRVIDPHELASWHATTPVDLTVHIDEQGSGLDLEGIVYAITLDLGGDDVAWRRIPSKDFGVATGGGIAEGTHWVNLRLLPPEGRSYLLIMATDRLGNSGYRYTPVLVDRVAPEISFEPQEGWITTSTVELRIAVRDRGGSGVDAGSVELSYSGEEPPRFDSWRFMKAEGSGESVSASFALPSCQGKSNHLKFRARDLSGNAATTTDFDLWVDSIPPQLVIDGPEDGALIDPPWSGLAIHAIVREVGSGVKSLKATLVDGLTGDEQPTVLDQALDPVTGEIHVSIEWYSRSSPRYAFSLLCVDVAGNSASTRPITVNLNMPPTVSMSGPAEGATFEKGTPVNFSVDAVDPNGGLRPLSYFWTLDGRPIRNGVSSLTLDDLFVGPSKVSVMVTDGYYCVNATVNVTVVGPPSTSDGEGGDGQGGLTEDSPIMGIAAIVGMTIVFAVLRALDRKGRG